MQSGVDKMQWIGSMMVESSIASFIRRHQVQQRIVQCFARVFPISGDAPALHSVAADLADFGGVSLECRVGSVLVTGIVANDLLSALQAVARPPRTVTLLPVGPRFAHSATDRLSAWEYSLATEATSQQAVCHGCGGQDLTPVTAFDGICRSMVTWC
jgi:hypothetical protein